MAECRPEGEFYANAFKSSGPIQFSLPTSGAGP